MITTCVKFLFVLLAIPAQKSQLQNLPSFDLTIQFAENIKTELAIVGYDDGISKKEIAVKKNQKYIKISRPYSNRYATISILYKLNNALASTTFWVGSKKSYIKILGFNSANKSERNEDNRIRYKQKNARNIYYNGEMQYLSFTSKERIKLKKFEHEHMALLNQNDSNTIGSYLAIRKELDLKSLDFIKANNKLYYSLWLMNNQLKYIGSGYDQRYSGPDAESLISFFKNNFSNEDRSGFEANEILHFLNARSLKSKIAPDFSVYTRTNQVLKLSNYRNKYVIVNFWATWCVPCIKELPALGSIRQSTNHSDLEIISISLDAKNVDIDSAASSHGMTWLNAYSTDKVLKDYGITGIPELLLIDPNGRVIYRRDEETDDIYSLPKLKTILSKIM